MLKSYILIFIARKQEIDKDNESMSRSINELMKEFLQADLSIIDESIDPKNVSQYHEFKEEMSKY